MTSKAITFQLKTIITLSSLRGLRGAPEVPPLCRETQSLGQQMLNATVGINGSIMQRLCTLVVYLLIECTVLMNFINKCVTVMHSNVHKIILNSNMHWRKGHNALILKEKKLEKSEEKYTILLF